MRSLYWTTVCSFLSIYHIIQFVAFSFHFILFHITLKLNCTTQCKCNFFSCTFFYCLFSPYCICVYAKYDGRTSTKINRQPQFKSITMHNLYQLYRSKKKYEQKGWKMMKKQEKNETETNYLNVVIWCVCVCVCRSLCWSCCCWLNKWLMC